VARLNKWLPRKNDMPEYLPLVRDLLNGTVRNVLAGSNLDAGYHDLYRALVLATAWQETCWRQFTVEDKKLVPIRSPSGATGLMQVLPSVWRGFYTANGLAWDIHYNAVAGSEILMHYLEDYAIARGEHEQDGGADNLPKATYAAYNGGPGHLSRYRANGTSESLRRIDRSFWDKYQAMSGGDELAVLSCYTG
jgi:soluble lytic murein transglycosylase-like protein